MCPWSPLCGSVSATRREGERRGSRSAGAMTEHARRKRGHVAPGPLALDDEHRVGAEALHFTRWFLRSKYRLMGEFLGDLSRAPAERDPAVLRERFSRAIQHAHRVHQARSFVTALLALGVFTAAGSAVGDALGMAAPFGLLERVAAIAASASVLLVALRLLFDRYLERVDVAATFLGIELATCAT